MGVHTHTQSSIKGNQHIVLIIREEGNIYSVYSNTESYQIHSQFLFMCTHTHIDQIGQVVVVLMPFLLLHSQNHVCTSSIHNWGIARVSEHCSLVDYDPLVTC